MLEGYAYGLVCRPIFEKSKQNIVLDLAFTSREHMLRHIGNPAYIDMTDIDAFDANGTGHNIFKYYTLYLNYTCSIKTYYDVDHKYNTPNGASAFKWQ